MASEKLTLWQAILININIMFGSGIFINTVNLNKIAGIFGFVSYVIVALILLPLIFSMMALISRYPKGGFYIYAAKELGPFFGFVSAWAYFIGKLASASLLIQVFSLLIQTIITPLQQINLFVIDFFMLLFFMWLNHFGIKTGTRITYAFIFCKITPILFCILSSIYLINHWSIPSEMFAYEGIPVTIPLVLYAFVGFEAACSFSLTIKNPEKNAPRALLYSFLFTIFITIIYQLITSLAIGDLLLSKTSFLDIFPTFFTQLFAGGNQFTTHLLHILHIAGAVSALGGAYGMIFSNSWNLYILAENNHVFWPKTFIKKNEFGIPFACVLTEGVICMGYLLVTRADQIILQQISVFGCSIAFMLSVLALLHINFIKKEGILIDFIPLLAAISSLLLFILCLRNFFIWGINYLFLFCGGLLLGILMFYFKKQSSYLERHQTNQT